MATKILGAGLSGICAAINLARRGNSVSVHEIRSDVGMRFHANLQGLKYVDDPVGFMESMGVESEIKFRYFPKIFFCTRSRDIEITTGTHKQMALVERGEKNSLEYALYKEAEKLGVQFEFNTKMQEKDASIVAIGAKRADFSAMGIVFEDTDFPRDSYLIMFDDRYSPKGWYSYIMPISKDRVEFVNCVSKPYIPQLAKLTEKAIDERRILRDFLGSKKRVAMFGGSGGCLVPKTAVKDGRYYVGEAAGFQDPSMGFGMAYALKSGKLCADAICDGSRPSDGVLFPREKASDIEPRLDADGAPLSSKLKAGGGDYDALWKKELMPSIRKDFARRFAMSMLGDALPDYFMRKYKNGDSVDVSNAAPEKFPFYGAIEESFFLMEKAKHKISGNW